MNDDTFTVRSVATREVRKMQTPGSPHRVSRSDSIVCPMCESDDLRARSPGSQGCDSCGHTLDGADLITLRQIVALPDAIGSHACECGHPEMRLLPDGVFHCPACGSEIIPA